MASQISEWLEQLGLSKYAQVFIENEVDLDAARDLTDEDLKDLGLPLGPRKKLLRAIVQIPDSDKQQAGPAPALDLSDGPDPEPSGAERRHLTVMFCDLVGSTELATTLDPEDMHALLAAFQETCGRIATDHGGHVAKLLGDGILIYYGYPKAQEDDAERAVRAALGTIDAVKEISVGHEITLQSRIGIASGVVVIGDILSGGGADIAAISGSVPHLAARLESAATPNSALIAQSTRRLIGRLFDLQQNQAIDLKGFDEPISAFTVLGTAEVESRFAATRDTGGGTFVGRENELGMLQDCWAAATESEGQAVLISGEAGLGKSRLLAEFCNAIGGQAHTRLRYQCSPQHTNAPLYPITTQLRTATGLNTADSVDGQLDKMEAVLGLAVSDVANVAPVFANLLGIAAKDRYSEINYAPERFKALAFEALISQFEGLAAQ